MYLIVGHASFNELGTAYGGQKGDQVMKDGKEVYFFFVDENYFYANYSKIFRPPTNGGTIADAMYALCYNENVGYGQDDRNEIYNYLSSLTVPAIKAMNTPVNVDCSSAVALCCKVAGFNVTEQMNTSTEESILTSVGFHSLNPDFNSAKIGDVLWRNGHTAVVIGITDNPIEPTKGNDFWMGWTNFESTYDYGTPESASRQQNGNLTRPYGGSLGYGTYQFTQELTPYMVDGLQTFIARVIRDTNFTMFSGFYSADLTTFYDNVYNDRQGFASALVDASTIDFNQLQWVEDMEFLETYWEPLKAHYPSNDLDNLDPYIKGSFASFAIRDGALGSTTLSAVNKYFQTGNISDSYMIFNTTYPDQRWTMQYMKMVSDKNSNVNVYTLPWGSVPDSKPKKKNPLTLLFMKRRRRNV